MEQPDKPRRDFLFIATGAVAAPGAARVRKGPAPRNMENPDYFWTSDSSITLRELTVFERMEAKTL